MNVRSTPLDELTITVVVDNETDNLSSIDAGIPQLPEVASLLGRIPATRQHEGHDCIAVFGHLCVACHGLSVLVTGRVGDERHTVLFDVGPYGDVWLDNADRLGVDISTIERVFLSHWHWDHSGGLPVVVAAITRARRSAGLEHPVMVDLHPDRPDQRGVRMPSGTVVMLPEEPTPESLADAGGAPWSRTMRRTCSATASSSAAAPSPAPRATSWASRATSRSAGRALRLIR